MTLRSTMKYVGLALVSLSLISLSLAIRFTIAEANLSGISKPLIALTLLTYHPHFFLFVLYISIAFVAFIISSMAPKPDPSLQNNIIYLLEELQTVVGRDASCDIQLEGRSISKRHASITFHDTDAIFCEIEDFGTKNATYVNGDRLYNSKRSLIHGDQIRFGYEQGAFRFEYTNPAIIAPIQLTITDSSIQIQQRIQDGQYHTPLNNKKRIDPSQLPAAGATSQELSNINYNQQGRSEQQQQLTVPIQFA
ncbi:MAG: hypothetical protein EZS28_004567 [Streblomastix strix]|uniref:FHA domain-containing protein n=1 Tax=Streblomastix strix TaxID=222440 RepID=A0A5J4WZJ7_9EUKA|nr:MAG: hypothetical protein EZS28_004567 [Streblomastix strix]